MRIFSKHKWHYFEFETEIEGFVYLVNAEGVIGNDSYFRREDDCPTKVRILKIFRMNEDGIFEPYLPVQDMLLRIDSESWEYFQVNFVAHSSRDEI